MFAFPTDGAIGHQLIPLMVIPQRALLSSPAGIVVAKMKYHRVAIKPVAAGDRFGIDGNDSRDRLNLVAVVGLHPPRQSLSLHRSNLPLSMTSDDMYFESKSSLGYDNLLEDKDECGARRSVFPSIVPFPQSFY